MVYDINGNTLDNYKLNELTITSADRFPSIGTGVQGSFITPNGKVWMLTETSCYVVQNGSKIATITLDHTVGHANTANYDNGYAYVSDWTDGTLIHVFTVDQTNNTMTYSKDITVPTTHGRCQFYVFDDENQIYSCGWDIEHSTNSNYLVIELWKKGKDGVYVKCWESGAIGIIMSQGMCVHNNRMYLINNSLSYKHLGMVVVDLSNGVQIYDTSQTGAILNHETEDLNPIGEHTFICVTYDGTQFTLTES